MTSAREEILACIKKATRDVPESELPEDVPVERGYLTQSKDSRVEIVSTFAERAAEYRATVFRTTQKEVSKEIEGRLEERGVRRLVIPHDLSEGWIPWSVEVLRDDLASPLRDADLDSSDGVLTGCSLGIAQTGTIVLDAGAGQGRRAITLLPDYHLCVISERQVVGGVSEAFAALEEMIRDEGRALTFISGPSATSDIELERVEGVHGPRTLEILLVS